MSEDLQRSGSGSGLSVAALSDAQRLTGRWRVLVDFGVQTAVVCGPDADTAASDLYTDGLGRVKVQFAWDRWGVPR